MSNYFGVSSAFQKSQQMTVPVLLLPCTGTFSYLMEIASAMRKKADAIRTSTCKKSIEYSS
jgi:hypothetical protein